MSMDINSELFTGERFVPGIDDTQLTMEHYQRYYSVLPFVRDKIVLDAACGEGYGTALLATSAALVTGIDISADAIERARQNYVDRNNIDFIAASIAQLPAKDHSVDVVISFETIEHVAEELQWKFLDEIKRVLKEDGILIMSTPNKEIYSDRPKYHNEFHVKEFYRDEFLSFLHTKFSRAALFDQFFENVCILSDAIKEAKTEYYCPAEYNQEAKYYIAVAGNKDISAVRLSHIYVNKDHEYDKRIKRILQLQYEVEERNLHLKELDEEIENYRNRIEALEREKGELSSSYLEQLFRANQRADDAESKTTVLCSEKEKLLVECNTVKSQNIQLLEENIKLTKENNALKEINTLELETNARLKREAEEMEAENVKLRDSKKQHQEIVDAANRTAEEQRQKIAVLNQTILNKEGHINLLLETEREYEREKHSRTYRIALVFRRISTFFLPANSKRRFLAKILVKGIRHPKLMFHMINPRRIRNFFVISKKEGMDSVNEHYRLVEEYENSMLYPFQTDKLEVSNIEKAIDKTIQDYTKLSFVVPNQPKVSIIIPVYNQFEYTYNCLESIHKNSGDISYEIIVADDCSTDLTKDLEKVAEGINVIHNEKNLRFLLNCNNAARQASGEYIVFLNNDTQVQAGWLDALVSVMERDPRIGMAGSKLLYSDGHLQEAGGIIWKDASAWNYGNRQNPNDSEFSYIHETDYISGAAIMIRASLWKEIGGFDERFAPAYCEDSDLAFEVRRHGYKVVYQPKSEVVHFEGISNGTNVTSGQKKYQIENQKKFYEKWKGELEENHFDNGTSVFLARDRSRGQKHVLVIDHYIPQYDKDAGSKTTFMYLKMLVQKGFRITFLGDNFYQHEPYTTVLQQMGILVLYGPKYAEHWKEWLEENINCFDIFYLNRPHISIKYIDFIKERARGRIIYYGHDLHFLRLRREYEVRQDPELLKEAEKWREQELYIMSRTDMNYYPSSLEIEEIHSINPAIPAKAINAYMYDQFPALEYKAEDRDGLLFVGGFGHGPNLDAVLWFVDSIYPKVYRATGAPFYIVGSNAPEAVTKLAGNGIVVKGFVTEEALAQLYASCRIAVIPLRYGAGVKGKVVEALYYGMPIITTSVGAEGIDKIEDVAVVKDAESDLADAIISVYTDCRGLEERSHKSRQFIEERFNVEAAWAIVSEDFQGE